MTESIFPDISDTSVQDAGTGRNGFSGSTSSLPTRKWLEKGLQAAFCCHPRVAGSVPTHWQVLCIAIAVFSIEIAISRLTIAGAARFDLQAWLSGWWTLVVFVGVASWAFPAAAPTDSISTENNPRFASVAACFVLWLVASLPQTVVSEGLMAAIAWGWIQGRLVSEAWFYWSFYGVFMAWSLAVNFFLFLRFTCRKRASVFALILLAATGLTSWQFNERAWQDDTARNAAAQADLPRLQLSQKSFEDQQALWQRTIEGIAAERPGVTDVYGLVFAPFASEEVFRRESTMVSQLLVDRFDAAGRVIHLLNHASTNQTHPWATPLNLERAIQALARRMDLDNDVLVVYLTSHGARDFKLAAWHGPLDVEPLSPLELKRMLDTAGIRHRVIAVSACYSGGWVDVLASDYSLVMTAADATHTSYGCGRLSELTFFGRAVFDEQLRTTHSFEKAFAQAVPLIKQREIEAGKNDGFSNPQIRTGAVIAPVLESLAARLEAFPQGAPPQELSGRKSRP